MNSYSIRSARLYAVSLIVTAILICTSGDAYGQGRSEDRDNPALLSSNKVNDDLDGKDTQYFYKFTAGPGKLTVTFEVKASGGSGTSVAWSGRTFKIMPINSSEG